MRRTETADHILGTCCVDAVPSDLHPEIVKNETA